MKKIFIIANWKSNKTSIEAAKWLEGYQRLSVGEQVSDKEIIICPPMTLLSKLALEIKNLKLAIKLGVQDISPFDEGEYTGEVNGKQIKEFADYVIIGHSERRKYFKEDEEIINSKIEQAIDNELTPILCISDLQQIRNYNSKLQNLHKEIIIAYEPIFAVGTGQTDTPENANNIGAKIKQESGGVYVVYGGSVNAENVHTFTRMEHIGGVLVGKASLDSSQFLKVIHNA